MTANGYHNSLHLFSPPLFCVFSLFATAEHGVCFHMYAVKANAERRKKIPLFWENSGVYTGTGMAAMKRLNTLIDMGHFPKNEWPQDEQEKYGLGRVRTTQEFFDTFGIHVHNQTVEHHLCRFVGKVSTFHNENSVVYS